MASKKPLQDGVPAIAVLLQQWFQKRRASLQILQIGANGGDPALSAAILQARPNFELTVLEKQPDLAARLQANLAAQGLMHGRVKIIEPSTSISMPSYLGTHPHQRFDAAVSVNVIHRFTPEDRKKLLKGVYNVINAGSAFISSEPVIVSGNFSEAAWPNMAADARQRLGLKDADPVPDLLNDQQWQQKLHEAGFTKHNIKFRAFGVNIGVLVEAIKQR